MSNHLAIATVTATLQHVLSEAVVGVSGAGVTTGRPPAAQPASNGNGSSTATGINVFLYRVSPNAALRNDDLPTRDSDGGVTRRPCAALDLHYLLTFHGDETQLVPESLLGKTVAALHARPVLSRSTIKNAIDAQPSHALDESDLAAQVELVKLSPVGLTLDELSKLWSVFFQAPYSLSLAYLGSVVLVEEDVPYRAPLEVARPLLHVGAAQQPAIAQVGSDSGASEPIHLGSTLSIRGRSLRGEVTKVRMGEAEVAVTPARDDEITVTLSSPPFPQDALRPGIQGVRVVHELLLGDPPVPHQGTTSAAAPVTLRPKVATDHAGAYDVAVTNVKTDPEGLRSADVAVRLDMTVGEAQRVTLQADDPDPQPGAPARGYGFRAKPRTQPTDQIEFELSRVLHGDYLVRVQVDGADTPLELDSDPQSPTAGRYVAPMLSIP